MSELHPQRKHLQRVPVWLPMEAQVVYFVTTCCAERREVFTNLARVQITVECLQRVEVRLGWQVLNCCFMPDHVHLLLAPLEDRDKPLFKFMQRWKSCVTLRLKIGSIWQREFFDRLLRTDEKLAEKWNYIRDNPVRAGLCAQADDWLYSGTPAEILKRLSL